MSSERESSRLKPVPDILQVDDMSDELRTSIWNVLDLELWSAEEFVRTHSGRFGKIVGFSKLFWYHYFKKPLDEIPQRPDSMLQVFRDYFFSCEWFEVYDFVGEVIKYMPDSIPHGRVDMRNNLITRLNWVLERELSGYRFVSDQFVDITDEQEVKMLEEALRDTRFSGPTAHLQRSLELLADRENPDYRNSIKESISAVESMVQIVADSPKATLGDALSSLERSGKLHGALKAGFSSLYGYTSDEGGIRHAMLEEGTNITAAEAKYFLMSCTTFVNYLKAKI